MSRPVLRIDLKIITSAFVVAGFVLMAALPFVYRHPGEGASRVELANFGKFLLAYIALTCFVWLGAAMSAVFLIRKRVKELREIEEQNLRELVEGSLKDHQRRT